MHEMRLRYILTIWRTVASQEAYYNSECLKRLQKSKKDREVGMKRKGWRTALTVTAVCLLLTGCASDGLGGETVKEITLTAFVQQSMAADSGIWKGWAADRLLEDTGITVEFYSPGTSGKQKLKQHMASGTIPDLIGFKGLDQARMYMEAGLLLPMEQYEELLPSIFQTENYEQAIAYSRENLSRGDGSLYLMPVAIGPAAQGDYQGMPMLQWLPYQKAGRPALHTLEDYLDAVEEMLRVRPLNDTGEKNYGFSLFRDWDEYSASEVSALSWFYGIDPQSVSPLMETNVMTKTTSSILADTSFYKRALHFYYEANQRGLLDPDSRTQTYTNLVKKLSEGRVMFSWYGDMTGSFNVGDASRVNNELQPNGYVAVPAADMKIVEQPDQTAGRNWYFALYKDSRSVEKACELLNWLYDPQVEEFLYNGPEGITWVKDELGQPRVTEEGRRMIENKSLDLMPDHGGAFEDGTAPFHTLGLRGTVTGENGWPLSHVYWESEKEETTRLEEQAREYYGDAALSEYLEKNQMLAPSGMEMNLIPAPSGNLVKKAEAVGEIIKSISWDMIYAKSEDEFDRLWKMMQRQAGAEGMDEIEEFYQQAYLQAVGIADEIEEEITQ